MTNPENSHNPEINRETAGVKSDIRFVVNSQEEAEALVREFWEAMPHGRDLVGQMETQGDVDWSQQLTFGDRTQIKKGRREEQGKWIITFQGNHQPLSEKAIDWLKGKGIV